ncbi:hypothetical protein HYALB_00011999 [Hymenoscyphus albidus]|uniref:Aminotransferase class I/classII large domain-containing protein n=1 Tax=Hymenoscyphus albidus TaxID=595503 RepID=A0A9N9LM47_9HELO|nr:hypothetical protein HYALB_00011999 [Hymenoscyphus albidus]
MSSKKFPGLSARGGSNVTAVMPKVAAAVAARSSGSQIDLASAENWLIRPDIIEICKDAIANNLHPIYLSYPRAFAGFPEVLEAFKGFLNKFFNPGIPVEKEHLATSPGAASCIDTLLYNICDPGDGILVPGPYWITSSVIPVSVVTSDLNSAMSGSLVPALEAAFENSKIPIRGVLISNPQNPLGQCYAVKVIEECIKFCQRKDIHYISDKVHGMTSFSCPDFPEPVPFASALSLDIAGIGCDLSRVHIVWSTSKDLGQSGMRIGCTITQGNKEMAVGVTLASHTTTSSLSSICASAILTSPKLPDVFAKNSELLSTGYSKVVKVLKRHKLRYFPCYSGLYIYAQIAPNCDTWVEESRLVQRMKNAGVLVSSGRGYHGPENEKGWARIGFAIPSNELKAALGIMDNVFGKEAVLRERDKYMKSLERETQQLEKSFLETQM